jgi:hypothetical protein
LHKGARGSSGKGYEKNETVDFYANVGVDGSRRFVRRTDIVQATVGLHLSDGREYIKQRKQL